MLKGVICGKGGQGIITITHILGRLVAELNYPVISAETHGMAMRGGSVAATIKIGDFASASIAKADADFILSMDLNEAIRNFVYLKPEGYCIINTNTKYDFPDPYHIININASDIAEKEFGHRILAGQILIGKLIKIFTNVFEIKQCLTALMNTERINIQAIQFGFAISSG